MAEPWLTGAALVLYLAAVAAAVAPATGTVVRVDPRLAPRLLVAAVALHTLALAARWHELGHGPFTTLYEILSSNLWSLSLVFALASWRVRAVRCALVGAAPVWLVLGAWLLLADPYAGHLPPTYDTPLLYLHTLVGKAYLGLLLVAVALGTASWLRGTGPGRRLLNEAPDDRRLDELAHRFAAFAFVCETMMLIVGAVWAQDAWGRYWAWDPLESWAFVSWLALAGTLHARVTLRPAPRRHALWLAACFALAFLTFFGVPFLSTAPHKGAI